MGSYRIEESPNKRAGCKVKACQDHNIKIQKGELRLGTWVETERFQSWTYRHWGCVTTRVLANILEAIAEDGEPNFDLLDGFEDLSAENQAKIKEAILKGELDEADKTDHALLNGEANEDAQNEANGSPEKAKTDTKAKSQKRSRVESDAEEEAPSKKAKKAKGAAKEENTEEKPAKRSKARKTDEEEPAEPEKPARKSRKKAAAVNDEDHEEEAEVQPPAKKARGKATAANGEKPKRGRKKKVADDEE